MRLPFALFWVELFYGRRREVEGAPTSEYEQFSFPSRYSERLLLLIQTGKLGPLIHVWLVRFATLVHLAGRTYTAAHDDPDLVVIWKWLDSAFYSPTPTTHFGIKSDFKMLKLEMLFLANFLL